MTQGCVRRHGKLLSTALSGSRRGMKQEVRENPFKQRRHDFLISTLALTGQRRQSQGPGLSEIFRFVPLSQNGRARSLNLCFPSCFVIFLNHAGL